MIVSGRILDVSALVDYATARTVYMTTLVRFAVEQTIPFAIPAAALTQAWQQIPVNARADLGDLLDQPVIVADQLDAYTSADVGLLLHTADATDVVAGHVAWASLHRHWPVITHHPTPLQAIAPHLRIEQLP